MLTPNACGVSIMPAPFIGTGRMAYVKKVLTQAHKENISKALMGRARPDGAGIPAYTEEKILANVDMRGSAECWPWRGYVNEGGYGRLQIRGKSYYAHRVVYAIFNPGLSWSAPTSTSDVGFLMHVCDNPVCCNPQHLRVGTHADNMADKVAKGRQARFGSVASPRAKLTAHQVQEIRRRKSAGETKRAIAAAYGVSEATISGVCYGRTYQDLPTAPIPKHKFAKKLTTEDVIAIRKLHAEGEQARILAERYGVTERTIHRVLKRWSALE